METYLNNNEKIITFICPNCQVTLEVREIDINCRIFRCGVFKNNLEPINPHLSKQDCEKLIHENKIYGCGAALELLKEGKIIQCDYSK